MEDTTLIYFHGCPHLQMTRRALKAVGVASWQEVRQDDLPKDHELLQYVSPTIIYRKQVVYGGRSTGGGCTWQKPDAAAIKQRMEAAG